MELKKIVAICLVFIMQFMYSGVFYSFGEYYTLLVDDYKSTYAMIGFVGTAVSGFSNWVGPLSGKLVLDYSYEVVIPVSGLILAASFILTAWTTQAWQLFFTYSFLFGTSCGVLSHLSMSFLLDTLDADEVGFGVAFSHIGAGLGYIALSLIAANFTVNRDILSLKQLFVVYSLSGVVVMLASFASFRFLPKDIEKTHSSKQSKEIDETMSDVAIVDDDSGDCVDADSGREEASVREEAANESVQQSGWALLFSSNPNAMLLFISHVLGFTMAVIPFKFSIAFATKDTDDDNLYYYVPVGMGIATIISRFMFASLTKYMDSFSVNKLIQLGCVTSNALLMLVPQRSVGWILFGLSFYGLFNAHFPLVMLRTVDLLGRANHHKNFGVQCFAVGIGYFIGGVVVGAIYDATYWTFRYVFLTCVVFNAASLLFDELAFPQYSTLWTYSWYAMWPWLCPMGQHSAEATPGEVKPLLSAAGAADDVL